MVLPPRGLDPESPPRPGHQGPTPGSSPRAAPIDRDPPRKSGEVAGVTVAIVIANVAVFGLMVANGLSPMAPTPEEMLPWGASYGPLTLQGEWWRLITACFLHYGALHLAFNMYVLWDLGRATERIYGSLGFAIVYLVAGIGGSFASVMVGDAGAVSAGASGAVFGVAGAFLAFLLRNRNRIDPKISGHLRRSLLVFVGFNIMIGVALPFISQSGHIGGLVTGFVTGLLASPRVGPKGPERAYWAYPIVAATGAALCLIAYLGISIVR